MFSVEDLVGDLIISDLISNVSLISSVAGGRAVLERIDKVGAVYTYKLTPIPVTHEFIGDSTVFAFAFDIAGTEGGQEEVSLVIRNNLPVISPSIPSRDLDEDEDIQINLSLYESDVEDSGDDLRWEVVSSSGDIDVSLVGKILTIENGDSEDAEIVLRLFDLDGDYDQQVLDINPTDSSDDGCSADWDCSSWSECIDGLQSRTCYARSSCRDGVRPSEIRSCSAPLVSGLGGNGFVSLGGSSYVKSDSSSLWWAVWVAAIFLLLLLALLFFLLRR
jgi:hypothetical protein